MNVFEGKIPDFSALLKDAAQESAIAIQGYIGAEMGDRPISEAYRSGASDAAHDESTAKNSTNVLRTASGRLFKSFAVRGGKPANEDGIFSLTVDDAGVNITIGTKVEYAAIHEHGGTMPARFVASKGKMHKFFWRKYYATKDKKWMWAAIKVLQTGGVNIKSYAVSPRPFLDPAMKRFEDEGIRIIQQRLLERIMQAINNG